MHAAPTQHIHRRANWFHAGGQHPRCTPRVGATLLRAWNAPSLVTRVAIDAAAKKAKVAVAGTGVNLGFAMDALPIALTGICERVDSIRVDRVQDARIRRLPFQQKIGSGLTEAEFAEKVKACTVRHVGLTESVAMIADALGWKLDRVTDEIAPKLAAAPVESAFLKVPAGRVCGIVQDGVGFRDGTPAIVLHMEAYLGAPETFDTVTIEGVTAVDPQQTSLPDEWKRLPAYPMKPGKNEVRISYRVDYPSVERIFKHRVFYDIASTRVLVLPADLKVESGVLSSAGSDPQTGASAYIASGLSHKKDLEFLISGQAPEVSEAAGDPASTSTAAPSPDDDRVVRIPNRIYQKKGIILGSLGFFFVLVILFAIRQSASQLETISSKKKK